MHSFCTLKANRNLRLIANDLQDYCSSRIYGGGVIAIDSKYNMPCLTDLRNRHTCQRNARRKLRSSLEGRGRQGIK